MKRSKTITEITLEDFLKLGLKGYEHRRHYFDADGNMLPDDHGIGETVKDSKGNEHFVHYKGVYSKITWDQVDLGEIVKENVAFSEDMGFRNRCICVAIHTEPTKEEIAREAKRNAKTVEALNKLAKVNPDIFEPVSALKRAEEGLRFHYSYLDKWLTPRGNQTYLLRCDVGHLYSERRKFTTHDGEYFEVPKSETKAIYLVRY